MTTKDTPAPTPVESWLKPEALQIEKSAAEKVLAQRLLRLLVHDAAVNMAAAQGRMHEPLAQMLYNDRLDLAIETYEGITDPVLGNRFLEWLDAIGIVQKG